MNNISNVLPMISIEFDPGATTPQSEPADSSSDDFASMLASMWCAPVVPQQLTPEVVVEPETSTTAVTTSNDCAAISTEVPALPTGDAMFPQPILKYEIEPDVIDQTPVEQVVTKIALPDISLLPSKEKIEDEPQDTEPIVIEQTPASSDVPTVNEIPWQEGTRVEHKFVRSPIEQTPPDPAEPKGTIITRRPPTFIEQAPVSGQSPEVVVPDLSQKVVSVSVQTTAPVEQVKTAAVATDQVTAEAIKREANLAASYLAESTRDSRDTAFEAIKAQVSGNASQSDPKDSTGDSDSNSKETVINVNVGSLNFATALKRNSIETVKEIINPQIANQIADLAAATQPRQQRSVRLRLRPEELGQVDIQLSRDAAGKVSAQVVVEREAARAALTQSLPQLREALERAGLNVDRLNVSSDSSSFSGTARDGRQSTSESQRSAHRNETSTSNSEMQSKERIREHKLLSLSA